MAAPAEAVRSLSSCNVVQSLSTQKLQSSPSIRLFFENSPREASLHPRRDDDGTIEAAAAIELSETLRDLANLSFAGLVLGQFLAERPVSWWWLAVGLLLWFMFVVLGLVVSGGE